MATTEQPRQQMGGVQPRGAERVSNAWISFADRCQRGLAPELPPCGVWKEQGTFVCGTGGGVGWMEVLVYKKCCVSCGGVHICASLLRPLGEHSQISYYRQPMQGGKVQDTQLRAGDTWIPFPSSASPPLISMARSTRTQISRVALFPHSQ